MSVIGVDEVGRGSLAGPVVIAAVYLDSSYPIQTNFYTKHAWYDKNIGFSSIRDSKKLSLKKRLQITDLVQKTGLNKVILSASNQLIDEFGIGVCLSYLVLFSLYILTKDRVADTIIVDGKIKILTNLDPVLAQKIIDQNQLKIDLETFIEFVATQKLPITRENFADDKYLAVALASNIAKVYRDNIMDKLSQAFPSFEWQKNKGYGTASHRKAILNLDGKNQHLRQTFLSRVLKSNS